MFFYFSNVAILFIGVELFELFSGTVLAIVVVGHQNNIPMRFERNQPMGIGEVGV